MMDKSASSSQTEGAGVYTIAVVGGGGVGKSSLIRRFIHLATATASSTSVDGDKLAHQHDEVHGDEATASSSYEPTLQDEYSVRIATSLHPTCVVNFIDTAGQEQYQEARREAMSAAQAFLLVYDINQRMSFEECEGFVDDVCRVTNKDSRDLPMMVIGNKNDRPADRQVSKEDLEAFAEDIGCPWREISAADGSGVLEALRALLEITTVHYSAGKEGMLSLSMSTVQKWKKYWFVLNGNELKYYKSSKDVMTAKPKDIIKLEGMIEVKRGTKELGREDSLVMITPHGTFFFEASNSEERDQWVITLKLHARAEMMRKLNFPFEERNSIAESSNYILSTRDAPRKKSKPSSVTALPVASSGEIRTRGKKKEMSEEEEPPEVVEIEDFTIAVLGGGGVGKSSLITRFLSDQFYDEDTADPTLQDEYTGRIVVNGCERVVTFIDTAGQEQYCEARRQAISSAQGFLLVFDATQRMSFEECEGFVDDICRVKNKDSRDLPVLVLSNKNDHPESKQVSAEMLQKFAESIGSPWREVCAASGTGVKESLASLIELISFYNSPGREGNLWISMERNPRWKKRWFVLRRDELTYYKNSKDALFNKHPVTFKLEGTTEVRRVTENEVKREHCFSIVTPLGNLFLSAESKREANKWFDILRRHAQAVGIQRNNLTLHDTVEVKGEKKQSGASENTTEESVIDKDASKKEASAASSAPVSLSTHRVPSSGRRNSAKILITFLRTSLGNLRDEEALSASQSSSASATPHSESGHSRSRLNQLSIGRKASPSQLRAARQDRPRSFSESLEVPPFQPTPSEKTTPDTDDTQQAVAKADDKNQDLSKNETVPRDADALSEELKSPKRRIFGRKKERRASSDPQRTKRTKGKRGQ